MEIQNKFQVEDRVKIKTSEKIGTISSLSVNDKEGKDVRYFVDYPVVNGKIEGRWFSAFELEKV